MPNDAPLFVIHGRIARHKVWLLLEEKEIPYKVVKVPMRSYGDKPEWFMQKVRGGMLPAIELDGKLVTESLVRSAPPLVGFISFHFFFSPILLCR